MAALPYMQLYVADYLADTMHLTTEEHGAYLLLIFNYWQTGKPIPKKRLARVARLSNDRWTAVEDSLSEFFYDNGTEWVHKRIEADLAMVEEAQAQRAAAGKASAEARKRAKSTKKKREINDRSTTVEEPLQRKPNENPTNKDTDTDTDSNNPPMSPQGEAKPESSTTDPPPEKPGRKRKTQIPEDFTLTDERRRKAVAYWHERGRYDLNPDSEFAEFMSYHRARGSTMANWDAAWQTWYARTVKYTRPNLNLIPGGQNHAPDQRPDNSAAGRVRQNVQREREQWAREDAQRAAENPDTLDDDELDVWPQVDEFLRG